MICGVICGVTQTKWQLLVSNNREGKEETARDVVEGYEGIDSGLEQDNAMCLSGAV